ncbi:MAG: Ig-like domain-containing protein [Candidatus Woesearchaeota archaeon]
MKRGFLILFFILLLAGVAYADGEITSTAVTTTGDYNNKTFFCTGSTVFDDQQINKAELLIKLSGSSGFTLNKTNTTFTPGKSVSLTFETKSIPAGSHTWKCRVYLQNNSNANSSEQAFSSTAPPIPNTPPQFSGPLPNVTIAEDTSNSSAFDLDNFFSDPDVGDTLAYSYSGSSVVGTHLIVTIGSGNVVSIEGKNNWSGTATVSFTASDGVASNTSNTVTVNVTAVNDAPYLSAQIPSQNLSLNTNKVIDLGNYFADEDSSNLNYSVSTSPSHVTVNISGDDATFIPETDWSGSTTVVFSATDGIASVNSNTITITVGSGESSSNTAPVIGSHLPILPSVSMEIGDEKTFSITKSDTEDGTLTVKWMLEGDEIDDETSDSYKFKAEKAGTFKLKVSVSDGDLSTAYTWTIKILEDDESGLSSSSEEGSGTDLSSVNTYSSPPVCGDGKVDEGEDCLSCEADAPCALEEICDEGVCKTKSTAWKIVVLVLLILGVAGSIGYLAYYIILSRKIHHGNPFDRPTRKLGSSVEISPASDFSDFLHKKEQQLKGEYKKGENPKVQKDGHDAPDPSSALRQYVENMRKAGHSDAEIKENLKSKGWKGGQIGDVLK